MNAEQLKALSLQVVNAGFQVHEALGPGLLESAYCACFLHELRLLGLHVKTEVPVPVIYKGQKLQDVGFRLDFLVENELIVEVKALETVAPVHVAQLVSYLKLADKQVGLLLNFNVPLFKEGIYRRVNRYPE